MKSENSGNDSQKKKATKTRRFKIDPNKKIKLEKSRNNVKDGNPAKQKKKHSVASGKDFPAADHSGKELKIIPLGGLGEVGKNMTAFEYGNDMIIVDVGMSFPDENMPGVDCVIPDFTYVRRNQEKLRGIVLTHGHEDHIGSLPYFLREFQCPVYGGTMTIELVRLKLQDKNVPLDGITLQTLRNGDHIKLGMNFDIEFIRVNHSIADSYCLAIKTPVGVIVHSGDLKIDFTPING